MATVDNATLERHLKKTTIQSNVLSAVFGIITAISFGYGFYYKTNDTLDAHTIQIEEVKNDVKGLTEAVNTSAIFQGATKEQMKSANEQIVDIKKTQDRIEDKIDRLMLKNSN